MRLPITKIQGQTTLEEQAETKLDKAKQISSPPTTSLDRQALPKISSFTALFTPTKDQEARKTRVTGKFKIIQVQLAQKEVRPIMVQGSKLTKIMEGDSWLQMDSRLLPVLRDLEETRMPQARTNRGSFMELGEIQEAIYLRRAMKAWSTCSLYKLRRLRARASLVDNRRQSASTTLTSNVRFATATTVTLLSSLADITLLVLLVHNVASAVLCAGFRLKI